MVQKEYSMVGKLLDNGLIVIKKDIRELLELSQGDYVKLTVKKLESPVPA